MTRTEVELKHAIMRRVWTVYFVRMIISPEMAKGAILGACCASVVFLVSIPSVIANVSQMPGILEGAAYIGAAFLHTSFVVEGVVVLAFGAGAWLAYDMTRTVSPFVFRRLGVFQHS